MDALGIGSRVKHSNYGQGVVINVKPLTYMITFMEFGTKEYKKEDPSIEVIDAVEPDTDLVSLYDVERSLIHILKKYSDYPEMVELGKKWVGGKMILKPGEANLASKEIPIDQLFHKIVMIRDRLRTLEQRVNANSKLDDEEKVNMQQYITRCYGSLTTFNVLFKFEHDQFSGEKTKNDE
jgi:hypothetical protein